MTDDELLALWPYGPPQRMTIGHAKLLVFARAIERRTLERAAQECARLDDEYVATGMTREAYGADECADAILGLIPDSPN